MRGGAPIVPGTTEFAQSADEIRAFGEENGWPVAIKAAFGGGGRGMKVVQSADKVDEAMASAQREAKNFFGRDEVYVERYLTWPRHVEVQIVGDTQGDVVWVSTRDCSAQRRHQKLIEEAPAPGAAAGVEDAMGEAAVKAAKAVGYYNAGTVEFIYQDGDFFFLEMNTRLQVEHPVTEVITGIDLVEWQIRVAVRRAAADDPGRGPRAAARPRRSRSASTPRTRPAASSSRRPARSPSSRSPTASAIRFDGGYAAGDEVSQYYDNLVGKLDRLGQGPRRLRSPARSAPSRRCASAGVATTIPADLAILRHPDFAAVDALDEVGRGDARPVRRERRAAAAPTASRPRTARSPSRWCGARPRSRSTASASTSRCGCPSRPARSSRRRRRRPRRASRGASPPAAPAARAGSGDVTAPMQGTIVKVLVEVGQAVEVGAGHRRARGDEDGEPDRRREGRHGQGDQGRSPATPSAAATSSPSSSKRPDLSTLCTCGRIPAACANSCGIRPTRRLRRGSR